MAQVGVLQVLVFVPGIAGGGGATLAAASRQRTSGARLQVQCAGWRTRVDEGVRRESSRLESSELHA